MSITGEKFSGKVAEYEFAAELIKRNIVPCWPSVEAAPYDLLCDLGARSVRIQVKGTQKREKKLSMRLEFTKNGKETKYTEREVDFIVVKVFEADAWYIFPIAAITSRTLNLFPYNHSAKLNEYKEAWHLLK